MPASRPPTAARQGQPPLLLLLLLLFPARLAHLLVVERAKRVRWGESARARVKSANLTLFPTPCVCVISALLRQLEEENARLRASVTGPPKDAE